MPSQTDRNGASFRDLRFVCFALLLVFLPAVCVKNVVAVKDSRFGAMASPVKLAFPPQQLTEIGTTQLHTMIDAAELADLRWPKFVKYRTEVRDFYDSCDGALPWMRELRPTSQALAIIHF